MKLELYRDEVSKNTQMPKFVKFRPIGAALFHADGQRGEQTERHT
jgi:hypothetical protein